MKKLLFTLLLLQYVIVALGAKVVVHKTWIEYGVVSNNEEGIYLHTKFDVYGMKGKTIRVIFYFYNQRKQKIFSDVSGYRTDDNHLCKSKTGTPRWDNSVYDDFKVFIPYRVLPLKKGVNSWLVKARVYDETNKNFLDNNIKYAAFKRTATSDNTRNQIAQNTSTRTNSNYSSTKTTTQNTNNTSNVPPYIDCAYCHGTGKYMCNYCAGNGWKMESHFIMYQGYVMNKVTCQVCSGSGKSNYCIYCNSTGKRPNPDYISSGSSYSVGSGGGAYSSGSSSSSSGSSSVCKYCGGGGGCSSCKGTGHKYNSYSMSEDTCPSCNGSGRCFNCRCIWSSV